MAKQRPADLAVSERQSVAEEALYERDLDRSNDIIRQRLESGDVFVGKVSEVQFKRQDLVGYWCNAAISSDRLWQCIERKGWIPVLPDMVADLTQLGGFQTNADGHVVRGQRGEEHLLCMTRENRDRIMRAKTDANNARLGSSAKSKADIAEAAASQFGDQAGEAMRSHLVGEVTDHIETVHADEIGPG